MYLFENQLIYIVGPHTYEFMSNLSSHNWMDTVRSKAFRDALKVKIFLDESPLIRSSVRVHDYRTIFKMSHSKRKKSAKFHCFIC